MQLGLDFFHYQTTHVKNSQQFNPQGFDLVTIIEYVIANIVLLTTYHAKASTLMGRSLNYFIVKNAYEQVHIRQKIS
jgi:hypothetical protein